MNIKNKFGKISEIIGKFLFYSSVIIFIVIIIVLSLTKIEGKDIINLENNHPPESFEKVGILIGNLFLTVIVYYLLKALFKPIYNLNKNIQLKLINKLSDKEFKRKWNISLICSLIFGILLIVGTLGISLLVMIPHYLLLRESKNLFSSNISLLSSESTIENPIANESTKNKENMKLSIFNKSIDFKKLNEKEVLFLSVGTGIIIALILGSIFCKTNHYMFLNLRPVKVSKKLSVFELCEFNYVLAIITFILITGGVYFYFKQKNIK